MYENRDTPDRLTTRADVADPSLAGLTGWLTDTRRRCKMAVVRPPDVPCGCGCIGQRQRLSGRRAMQAGNGWDAELRAPASCTAQTAAAFRSGSAEISTSAGG